MSFFYVSFIVLEMQSCKKNYMISSILGISSPLNHIVISVICKAVTMFFELYFICVQSEGYYWCYNSMTHRLQGRGMYNLILRKFTLRIVIQSHGLSKAGMYITCQSELEIIALPYWDITQAQVTPVFIVHLSLTLSIKKTWLGQFSVIQYGTPLINKISNQGISERQLAF